jgi:hypothetical protein
LRPNRFRSRPPAACTSEADGRLCRNARLPDMCERSRANAKAALGMARAPSFFTMSNSPLRDLVPRRTSLSRDAFLRPGWLYPFAPDAKRGGRSADRRTISVVAFARRDGSARVRRGASHDGTLASRRSTVAVFGRGPRFHLRHCLRIRAASSSQPGRHAWRAVSRTSRARGYEPRPQDATPRSAFQDRLRKTPLHERGCKSYTINSLRSQ